MVNCRKCRFCYHIVDREGIREDWWYCRATDECIDDVLDRDELPCDFYVEELDDNETEESSA